MDIRRVLVVASVLLGLVTAMPGNAATTHAMDGKKRTKTTFKATLSETSVPLQSSTPSLTLTPALADCRPRTCDVRELRLTLPKGTSWGWFEAVVTAPRELVLSVVLYDAKGKPVAEDNTFDLISCCDETSYTMTVKAEQLRGGKYTLAVIDRAGVGDISGTLTWHAYPPDRKR